MKKFRSIIHYLVKTSKINRTGFLTTYLAGTAEATGKRMAAFVFKGREAVMFW